MNCKLRLSYSALALAALLTTSAAFAQSYPCSQSMIMGNWVTANLGAGGAICHLKIGTNGALTPSDCLLSFGNQYIVLPKGTLTIDGTCHVTGTVSFTWTSTYSNACYDPITGNPITYTLTYAEALSPQLWRSLDGSRLSGYTNETETVSTTNKTCYAGGVNQVRTPLELILIPQPPPPP